MKSIAIIGAGPGGLVAAKSALETGLSPTLFEKQDSLGGVWNPQFGHAWPGMKTNLSKYSCAFSDFAWSEGSENFPRKEQVFQYLLDYAKHFRLNPYIRFSTRVESVEPNGNGWQVVSRDKNERVRAEYFDAVIVASGFFSKPKSPEIEGIDSYQGCLLSASRIDCAELKTDQQSVIVGGSFSGVELAAEIANRGGRVVHITPKPFWVIPRYLDHPYDSNAEKVPLDFVFYRRVLQSQNQNKSQNESGDNNLASTYQKKNRYLASIALNPTDPNHPLFLSPDSSQPPYTLISDDYCRLVDENRIIPIIARAKKVSGIKVITDTQQSYDADYLLLCTGYSTHLPFFNAEILEQLKFDPYDLLQPLILYQATFAQDFNRLAFVGMYRGPHFTIMELQARWACAVFSDRIALPPVQDVSKSLEDEWAIRRLKPRPQFPHGDFVDFADRIAKQLGVKPDMDSNHALYRWLQYGPVIAAHYRLQASTNTPDDVPDSMINPEAERMIRSIPITFS